MSVDLSVIIVSFNTRELTLACVQSLQECPCKGTMEIIVVDNDSHDGTVQALRDAFGDSIMLIDSEVNLGFATANNVALRRANGEFLLLLNPDTEVYDGTLDATLAFAESRSDAGIIGVRCIGCDGEQQSTLFKDKRLSEALINVVVPNQLMRRSRLLGRSRYHGLDLDQAQDVEIVAGCFMLVRRALYERVGGMDSSFFMYGEDAEWCFRARKAGWRVVYFPGARILHHGGVSASQVQAEMDIEMARNHLLLVQKTRGRCVAYVTNVLMLLRDLPRAVAWGCTRALARHGHQGGRLRRSAARSRLYLHGLLRTDWSP